LDDRFFFYAPSHTAARKNRRYRAAGKSAVCLIKQRFARFSAKGGSRRVQLQKSKGGSLAADAAQKRPEPLMPNGSRPILRPVLPPEARIGRPIFTAWPPPDTTAFPAVNLRARPDHANGRLIKRNIRSGRKN